MQRHVIHAKRGKEPPYDADRARRRWEHDVEFLERAVMHVNLAQGSLDRAANYASQGSVLWEASAQAAIGMIDEATATLNHLIKDLAAWESYREPSTTGNPRVVNTVEVASMQDALSDVAWQVRSEFGLAGLNFARLAANLRKAHAKLWAIAERLRSALAKRRAQGPDKPRRDDGRETHALPAFSRAGRVVKTQQPYRLGGVPMISLAPQLDALRQLKRQAQALNTRALGGEASGHRRLERKFGEEGAPQVLDTWAQRCEELAQVLRTLATNAGTNPAADRLLLNDARRKRNEVVGRAVYLAMTYDEGLKRAVMDDVQEAAIGLGYIERLLGSIDEELSGGSTTKVAEIATRAAAAADRTSGLFRAAAQAARDWLAARVKKHLTLDRKGVFSLEWSSYDGHRFTADLDALDAADAAERLKRIRSSAYVLGPHGGNWRDSGGKRWIEFLIQYPGGSFTLWAFDDADARRRLDDLKRTARLGGEIVGTVSM